MCSSIPSEAQVSYHQVAKRTAWCPRCRRATPQSFSKVFPGSGGRPGPWQHKGPRRFSTKAKHHTAETSSKTLTGLHRMMTSIHGCLPTGRSSPTIRQTRARPRPQATKSRTPVPGRSTSAAHTPRPTNVQRDRLSTSTRSSQFPSLPKQPAHRHTHSCFHTPWMRLCDLFLRRWPARSFPLLPDNIYYNPNRITRRSLPLRPSTTTRDG